MRSVRRQLRALHSPRGAQEPAVRAAAPPYPNSQPNTQVGSQISSLLLLGAVGQRAGPSPCPWSWETSPLPPSTHTHTPPTWLTTTRCFPAERPGRGVAPLSESSQPPQQASQRRRAAGQSPLGTVLQPERASGFPGDDPTPRPRARCSSWPGQSRAHLSRTRPRAFRVGARCGPL